MARLLQVLLLVFASAAAMAQADPPGRVADLSWREGSVVFAPEGENEWVDLPLNRPLTRGDRVWTDRGARAELHLGSATLHVGGQSHLAFYELDDDAVQISLTQGVLHGRVRDLDARENFEVDTPNLAVRVQQPGEWRVDVDTGGGVTRVAVRSGRVAVYGERGESLALAGGQQMAFAGRSLQQAGGYPGGFDAFDAWAMERNRLEDQSVSARYVPRETIGYHQLDNHGSWSQDPSYGAVWYPRLTVADWAPYRYGHWAWIQPWGWTWVDDAPWGFAPFHYGRWAMIGSRWAWVPGRLGPRPLYAPALVVFVGGSGANWSLRTGGGPGIAWYPLAPGEAWWPTYRTSNVYVTNVNRHIAVHDRRGEHRYQFRQRPEAITAVAVNDFSRGRPVREHWQRVQPSQIVNAPLVESGAALPRPARVAERREAAPRLQQTPPPAAALPPNPGRGFAPPGLSRPMPVTPGRPEEARNPRIEQGAQREQERAQREQERQQRDAVRQQPERSQQQERVQQEQERQQREGARQQQEQQRAAQEQERAQRDAAARQQQERAAREQERMQREQERQQREGARQQQEQQRAAQEQERAQRDAAMRQQQERAAREQERMQREQERQQRQRPGPAPQSAAPGPAPQAERAWPGPRARQDEGRPQPHQQREPKDDEPRGRGQGRNG